MNRLPPQPIQPSCLWRAITTLLMLELAGALVVLRSEQMPVADMVPARLRDANTALARAMLVNPTHAICATALPAAIQAVSQAQLLVSGNDLPTASGRIVDAMDHNAACIYHLRWIHNSPGQHGILDLTLEAEEALKQVETLLSSIVKSDETAQLQGKNGTGPNPMPASRDLIDLESTNSTGLQQPCEDDLDDGPQKPGARCQVPQHCSPKQVDGTVCQFSACSRGRNLVSCAIGFARGVLGGYHGQSYIVTSDQDNPDNPPHGTLRFGLNLAGAVPGGVWLTFSRDMTIDLRAKLWVHSHTTVDGRGFTVIIQRHAIAMSGSKHVILENIQVNTVRGSDTVHIYSGCWKVWVDHVTSFEGDLGLVSVLQGSTDVTISNSRLSNHNFNMLLGASDNDQQDKYMRVTVYRNYFLNSMQRMPHCRWGWCHVANNLYANWGYYAIGARVNARVKTENNVFIPGRVTEVTPWHPGAKPGSFDFSARIESQGDSLLNGATFHQFLSATHDVKPPYPRGDYPPLLQVDKVRNLVYACAGIQTHSTVHVCQRAVGQII